MNLRKWFLGWQALWQIRRNRKLARKEQRARQREKLIGDMLKRRASLAAIVGAAALSTAISPAYANTVFTTWSFPGTGSPTSRTTPARIADIFNVKEYGVAGNGVTDDTSAIRAALAAMWASTYSGGVLFFPPGIYPVNGTIDISNPSLSSVYTNGIITGSGRSSTYILGTLDNGFIFFQPDQVNGPEEISHLALVNASTWIGSGALNVSNSSMVVRLVALKGMIGALVAYNGFQVTFENCSGNANSDVTTGYNGALGIAGYSPHIKEWRSTSPYSIGLWSYGSNGTVIEGCGIENSVVAIQLGSGIGHATSCTVSGNILTIGGTLGSTIFSQFSRFSRVFGRGLPLPTWGLRPDDPNSGAVMIIDDHASDPTLTGAGFAGTYRISVTLGSPITTPVPVYSMFGFIANSVKVSAIQTEACYHSIYLDGVDGCEISGGIFAAQPTECVDAFGVPGYTAHSGVYLLQADATRIVGVHSGCNPYAGTFYIDPSATCVNVTFSDCLGAKLADIVSNGSATISNGSGGAGTVLNIPAVASGSTIGIGMSVTGSGVSANTVITGNHASDPTLTGTGAAGTYRVNNSQNVSATTITVHTGSDWVMPTATASKAGLKFSNCGGTIPAGISSGLNTLNMTFTCLPGQAGSDNNLVLVEGSSFYIIDIAKAGGGTAAPNDATQGGGTQRGNVLWNGTSWIFQ